MNKVFPKIRFKNFEVDYEEKTLQELSQSISSGKGKPKESGKYKVYGSRGLIGFSDDYDYSKSLLLVARVGANAGKIYQASGEYSVTDNTLIIDLYDNVDINYILENLTCKKLERLAFGSGQPLVTSSQLKKIKLKIPSIQEQKKIVSFLTSVNNKINLLTKKRKLLEQYKKGIIQKMFVKEIRFKDDNGNDFPDWDNIELGKIIEESSVRNKDKKMSLVLSVSNKKGFISQEEQFDGYKVASKDLSNYKVVYKNEYAYNPSRINVGSIARLDKFDKGIVSPMYIVFRLSNKLLSGYFDLLINSHYVKHLIKVGCSGSVRDSLSFSEMKKFNINLPSIEEQTKIGNFINQLDEKLKLINSQIDKTKEFKKGLIQQMFV